jgi:hypothetical protein
MERRRREPAALVMVAVALGVGACARPASTPTGNRSATGAPDERAARLGQASEPTRPGARPARIWPACDASAAPPRRAAIVAYDGAGRPRWSVPLPAGPDGDSNVGPLVDGDVVISTGGDELRGLDAADGRQRWRSRSAAGSTTHRSATG